MRQHHTKVHGDPLPNRTCEKCDVEFYDPKSRRVYCDDCYSAKGEMNGNWRGAKRTATCQTCGDDFEYYPSDKEGVYCEQCVEAADEFIGTPYYEVHEIQRLEHHCKYCDTRMEVLKTDWERGRGRFCSHECLSAWMSDQHEGEAVYNGRWRQARRDALRRDEYKCQNCGVDQDELGQNPDVHHIQPVRTFDDPQEAHVLTNLVSLCKSCHTRVEAGSIPVPDISP